MSDFLKLEGKKIVVTGTANKKSVAWFTAKTLEEAGAQVIYSVRSRERSAWSARTSRGFAIPCRIIGTRRFSA